MMKSIKIVQIFVLFSMFFNISHASLISLVESCEHEHSVLTLALEETTQNECDDLCDIHHLFHFSAIVTDRDLSCNIKFKNLQPKTLHIAFHSCIHNKTIKPPIA